MNSTAKTRKRHISRTEWLLIIGLILLSFIPAAAGTFRMAQLSTGTEITADNARFFDSPLPVILHVLSVIPYTILGAFQFSKGLRRWKPKWHRRMGRILIVCGLTAALSGLWMSQFYALPETDGEFLYWQRLVFGIGMVVSILLAINAIWRRDYVNHGAWMMRAYAIGMGAGTQVFTHIPYELLFGSPDTFARAILMGAGWVINIAVAEWVIYRHLSPRKRKPSIITQGNSL